MWFFAGQIHDKKLSDESPVDTVAWDQGEKHLVLNNVHWYSCMRSKNWTMSTGGRVQSKKTSGIGSPVGWQYKLVEGMHMLV